MVTRTAALVVACAAVAITAPAHGDEPKARELRDGDVVDLVAGQPLPAGFRLEKRSRKGLVLAGALISSMSYATALPGVALCNLAGCGGSQNWLLIPLVGPLFQMAHTTNPFGNVVLAGDAIAQLGGLAMVIYGLAAPRLVLVKGEAAGGAGGQGTVTVVPVLAPGRLGLAATF